MNLTTPLPKQEQDCDPFLDSILVKTMKTIAYSVLLIVTFVGNSLVVVAIRRNPSLHAVNNFFILNLAIADLVMPLSALPIQIQQIFLPRGLWLVDGVFGSITCKLVPFSTDISLIVSVFSLEVIAIERFFAVVYPMKRQPIPNKKRCFILIALMWLIGALYPSINFYKFKIAHKETRTYCYRSWKPAFSNTEAFKVEAPVLLVCFTIVPFLLLTSLYSTIIISLHRQKGDLHLASGAQKRRLRQYRKITYMLTTVIIVYLLVWTPFNVYWFLRAFVWNQRSCYSRHLVFTATYLANTHSAINPFIYYIFSEEYRKSFKEIFCLFTRCSNCCKTHSCSEITDADINHTIETGASNKVTVLSMRVLGEDDYKETFALRDERANDTYNRQF